MIATGLPVISACDDAIVFDEDGSDSGIRARCSEPLPRFDKSGSHEFVVHVRWRHELKVWSTVAAATQ